MHFFTLALLLPIKELRTSFPNALVDSVHLVLCKSPSFSRVSSQMTTGNMREVAQAIVLAAGPGSRMSSLAQKNKAKCLLPIGTYPMIYFPLCTLERANFKEATVIVSKEYAEEVVQVCKMYGLRMELDIAPVTTDDFPGTLESLLAVAHKIKKDVDEVIIVSSDIVTDLQIQPVLEKHIMRGAALTMVTANRDLTYYCSSPPGSKMKQTLNNDIICKEKNTDRLLYSVAGGDYDKSITFPSCLVAATEGAIVASTEMVDTHLYVIKRWLLDAILSKGSPCAGMGSLKVEVIPYIISQQFKSRSHEKGNKPDVYSSQKKDTYEELISSYNTSIIDSQLHPLSKLDGRVCYAYHNESFCIRANTLPSYWQLNKQMFELLEKVCPKTQVENSANIAKKAQVGNDCIIGRSAVISEKTNITSSVIGNHSRINPKVRISNSVLFDYVTIAEECVIENSLICVSIEVPCIIKSCIVADSGRIDANKTYCNEHLEVSQGFIE